MNYSEFKAVSLGTYRSVFERRHFDLTTNAVKWVALPVAYGFYWLGFSANAVDIVGLFLMLGGFLFLSTAISGQILLPILGVLLIYFHVFLDFVDGPVAKARGACSALGSALDNIGCDLSRLLFLLVVGFYTGNSYMMFINLFAAVVLIFLMPVTYKEFPGKGLPGLVKSVFLNRYSFIGVRFMLGLLPLFLILIIINGWSLSAISYFISFTYFFSASLWLVLCIPNYTAE